MPPHGEGTPHHSENETRFSKSMQDVPTGDELNSMDLEELTKRFKNYKEGQFAINKNPVERRKEIVAHIAQEMMESLRNKSGHVEKSTKPIFQLHEDLFVRIDDPLLLMRHVMDDKPLKLAFDKKVADRYHNVAQFNPRSGDSGFKNALNEAHSTLGGVRTMVGFRENEDMDVKKLEEQFQLQGYPRHLVRSVEGEVRPEDIRFILMRTPADYFPKEELTREEERTLEDYQEDLAEWENLSPALKRKNVRPTQFIDRVFLFNEQKTDPRAEVRS